MSPVSLFEICYAFQDANGHCLLTCDNQVVEIVEFGSSGANAEPLNFYMLIMIFHTIKVEIYSLQQDKNCYYIKVGDNQTGTISRSIRNHRNSSWWNIDEYWEIELNKQKFGVIDIPSTVTINNLFIHLPKYNCDINLSLGRQDHISDFFLFFVRRKNRNYVLRKDV